MCKITLFGNLEIDKLVKGPKGDAGLIPALVKLINCAMNLPGDQATGLVNLIKTKLTDDKNINYGRLRLGPDDVLMLAGQVKNVVKCHSHLTCQTQSSSLNPIKTNPSYDS